MDLNTQVKFASIYSNFSNEAHTCTDIGTLIELIRFNKHTISNDAKRTFLQIPLVVLSTQVNLKNETEWAAKNSGYFSGNCPNNSYQSIFASNDFNLDTMVTFLKDIMSDDQKLNNDFYLRNPEVTLRDDVKAMDASSFNKCGKIYARIMEKAFEL